MTKPLETEDSVARIKITITDYFKMRSWDIGLEAVYNSDIGHIRYMFNRMPQKAQEAVVRFSKMVLEVAETE